MKTKLLHSQSAPREVLNLSCSFFSWGFPLGSVAPVAWKNTFPLLPILWPLDLVSSVSPAPQFVSLHNWHVESCFISMVPIPAALPCGTPVVLSSLSVSKDLAACISQPLHGLLLLKLLFPSLSYLLIKWHVQPWNRLIPGSSRSADWISKLGRVSCSVGNDGVFSLFAASQSGTEDSCSCRSPKGLQNSQMPFPQSADSRGLSVVVCDGSCGQEQRWSCVKSLGKGSRFSSQPCCRIFVILSVQVQAVPVPRARSCECACLACKQCRN